MDFAVPVDHRIKLKESEKKDRYLDLARKLKKIWNMKVTIIPIVIGAFGTVTKVLLKRMEDMEVGRRVETIINVVGLLVRVLCGCCVRDYHITSDFFFVKSFHTHAVFERSTKWG